MVSWQPLHGRCLLAKQPSGQCLRAEQQSHGRCSAGDASQTLIFLDWDDTIFPTTVLTHNTPDDRKASHSHVTQVSPEVDHSCSGPSLW